MFKTIRVLLNNINEKPYVRGKAKFKLYKDTEKNLTPLSKDSKEMKRIEALETTIRYDNLKVYTSNVAKLRGKQMALIVTPILLGALTIFSWVSKGYNKVEELPTYQRIVIEMDEENLYKDVIEPEKYFYTVLNRNIIGENVAIHTDTISGKAYINFGEGENAVQVTFTVSSDGTWKYSSYSTDSYFNLDGKDLENAQEIPTKYDNIISEAASIFKSKIGANSKTSKLIDEIIDNGKNDIIVNIVRYEKIGDISYETSHSYWLWRILLIFSDIVVGCLLWYYLEDLSHVKELDGSSSSLEAYGNISIIHAAMKYREALLQAETERISEIDSITKKNNGTGNILSKFEKKLILK